MAAPPTILVFDSGLGGLTVLREIVRARPDAHYIYVADDAFFPYGHHGEEEIIARVVPLIGELIAAHGPDLVVIACNTASTLVMSHRQRRNVRQKKKKKKKKNVLRSINNRSSNFIFSVAVIAVLFSLKIFLASFFNIFILLLKID